MAKKLFSSLNKLGSLAIQVGLIVYIGILLTRSMQQNIKTNKQIEAQKNDIIKLQDELETLKAKIAYYQSSSFYELEARKQLNLQLDDEKVVILPSPPKNSQNNIVTDSILKEKPKEKINKPNYLLWFDYYFNR